MAMNDAFSAFVTSARSLADGRGLTWNLRVAADGSIDKRSAWDLTAIAGAVPPPVVRLSDLGGDKNTVEVVNERLAAMGRPPVAKAALSRGWQDLIKAAVVQQILVLRNTPAHAANQVVRPLKVLGTCVQALSGREPWAMTADDVRFACEVATAAQASGKLGELVESVVKYVLDTRHLCDNGPFHHLLRHERPARSEPVKRGPQMRRRLDERKDADKLPELRALIELVRIVFTESPRTFSDAIRFAQTKILLLCGLRVGEVCTIPADWKRVHEWVALDGRPAGDLGGFSRSLRLRHFAEKMRGRDENSVVLYEAFQDVPELFECEIEETLDGVKAMTAPLRQRLRLQAETGRVLPEFAEDKIIPLTDLYVRLTGNPKTRVEPIPDDLMVEYRRDFDASILVRIADHQNSSRSALSQSYYNYWQKLADAGWPKLSGKLSVGDIEVLVVKHLPSKLSDTSPFPLGDGQMLRADELLFLCPKRALIETRNGGICDVSRYFSVGRVTPQDLMNHLAPGDDGIFARYGETEEDRRLAITSHMPRHLMNTELFRLCVADSIITKRFNRKDPARSYDYDHRSLAEALSAIDLPPESEALPPKARAVAAMIQARKASGPIVDMFRKVQKEHGNERAFEFLAAEADGFHATPYGHCLNSFTVDPCPKHLQCFDGCNHLVSTDIDRHRRNLETMRAQMQRAVEEIGKRRGGIGHDNQLKHARKMVASIEKVQATAEGSRPFPDGQDLSRPAGERRTPLDV
jgi:hypothetical protein